MAAPTAAGRAYNIHADASRHYASIYVADGSTAQSSIGTTPTKVTGFAANGPSNGATPDHTNDQITIGLIGVYVVMFQCSFSGSVSETFEFHLRVNGTEVAEAGFHRTLGTGGDVGSASFMQFMLLEGSDVLTVYVEAGNTSKSITPVDMQLCVFRLY